MSVKLMTVEQLRSDLLTIAATWPGGIPPEQHDRVNALKGELKRRGAEVIAPLAHKAEPASADPLDMSDEGLARELKRVSDRIGANPNDEAAMERFANVRFEIRKRSKQPQKIQKVASDDAEQIAIARDVAEADGKTNGNGLVERRFDSSDENLDRRVPRKQFEAEKPAPLPDKWTWSAEPNSSGGVLVTFHVNRGTGGVAFALQMSDEEAVDLEAKIHVARRR